MNVTNILIHFDIYIKKIFGFEYALNITNEYYSILMVLDFNKSLKAYTVFQKTYKTSLLCNNNTNNDNNIICFNNNNDDLLLLLLLPHTYSLVTLFYIF